MSLVSALICQSDSQSDEQDEKETAEDGDGLRVSSCFQSAVTELRPAAAMAVHDTHGLLVCMQRLCVCARASVRR